MRFKGIALTLLNVLAVLGGWSVAQGSEGGPRSLEARWEEAQNGGNLQAVADLFTQDGWFSPFDGTTMRGHRAIRAFFSGEGASPSGGPRIRITPKEYTVVGDLAYGHGTYTLLAPDGSQIATGNYLGVYRRAGGEWRIHRYMGNAVMPEGAQEVTSVETAEANKALVKQYLEAWSGKPKTEETLREFTTSEALIEHVKVFEAAFPRYELLIDDMVAEADKVVIRARARGRHEGEFAGIAPTGRQMETPALVMYRLEGDKIAEFWVQADMMGLIQQLTGER